MINRVKLCGVVLKIANPQGPAGALDKPKLLHAAPHFMNFGKELSIATRTVGGMGRAASCSTYLLLNPPIYGYY